MRDWLNGACPPIQRPGHAGPACESVLLSRVSDPGVADPVTLARSLATDYATALVACAYTGT